MNHHSSQRINHRIGHNTNHNSNFNVYDIDRSTHHSNNQYTHQTNNQLCTQHNHNSKNMKKNYQAPFNMASSFIAFIFCSTFLCGCSKSNFGVNDSFFSNISRNNTSHNDTSGKNTSREQNIRQNNAPHHNTHTDQKHTFKAHNQQNNSQKANHILKMSPKQIEDEFGTPSFTLQNKDIGNTKSYYSTSWYYVYYQIQNNNVNHNHKLIVTKCLVIRFDDSMNVVGAQYLYSK